MNLHTTIGDYFRDLHTLNFYARLCAELRPDAPICMAIEGLEDLLGRGSSNRERGLFIRRFRAYRQRMAEAGIS